MRSFHIHDLSLAYRAFLFAVMFAGPVQAQPTITTLGGVADGSFTDAFAVSANAQVVAGVAFTDEGEVAALWDTNGELQSLGIPTGSDYTQALGISSDGSVVAGYIAGPAPTVLTAFRWTAADGFMNLGLLPGGNGTIARGVSADGSVVVGWANMNPPNAGRAFRWTAAGGIQGLGVLSGGISSNGFGVSADGLAVTGGSESSAGDRAFRWTAAGGMQNLGVLPGKTRSTGAALNANGSVVAGYSYLNNGTGILAFRWTAEGGMQSLGVLDGGTQSYARAISANGSLIVGGAYIGSLERAFLWSSALGMVDLNTYLPTLGMDLDGFELRFATGISADGSAIVGIGTLDGEERSFLVRGLPGCGTNSGTGDGNADGETDGLDIPGIVNLLIVGGTGSVGACAYDMNRDGLINEADVSILISTLLGV